MTASRRRGPRRGVLWVCVALGIAIGVALAVRSVDGSGSRASGPTPIHVRTIRPGTAGAPNALWLFGTATLRFPPRVPTLGHLLPIQGFGFVLGAPGRVDLFDPARGTAGVLDARHNRLRRLGAVPVAAGATRTSNQPLADAGGALWLVTGPRALTRLPRRGGPATTVPLAADLAGTDGTTLVVAGDGAVWTATSTVAGDRLSRLDPTTGELVSAGSLPSTLGGRPLAPVALVASGDTLFVVGARGVVTVDNGSGAVTAARALRDPRMEIAAATVARGSLWVLDRTTARALRIDHTGSAVVAVAVQGTHGPLRLPAALAAAGRSVWVLAPATGARIAAERVSRLDAVSGRITTRFTTPASLEIGALTLSG